MMFDVSHVRDTDEHEYEILDAKNGTRSVITFL